MNNLFDSDFIIIIGGLILLVSIENINPYIVFLGGIMIIIASIYKIIILYYDTKINKAQYRKLMQEWDSTQLV